MTQDLHNQILEEPSVHFGTLAKNQLKYFIPYSYGRVNRKGLPNL